MTFNSAGMRPRTGKGQQRIINAQSILAPNSTGASEDAHQRHCRKVFRGNKYQRWDLNPLDLAATGF